MPQYRYFESKTGNHDRKVLFPKPDFFRGTLIGKCAETTIGTAITLLLLSLTSIHQQVSGHTGFPGYLIMAVFNLYRKFEVRF